MNELQDRADDHFQENEWVEIREAVEGGRYTWAVDRIKRLSVTFLLAEANP